MLKSPVSKSRNVQKLRSRRIASTVLCASLMASIAWVEPTAAIAQTTLPDLQPPVGMRTTSPLATRSTRPAGIPLGSTEIARPGVSPVAPSQSALMEACAGSDGARSSGAPFDGGGISGATPLSCADSRNISSPLPPPSSIGSVGIPMGATEIGGAGVSPAAPVAGPGLSSGVSPANSTRRSPTPAIPEAMLHRGIQP
jgi:hypothetical protein